MRRMARLACFSLLGFLVAAVIYGLLLGVLEVIRLGIGGSPETYSMVSFAAIVPVALFLGSGLTGYLSRPYIRTWFGLVGVSPGLYPSVCMISINVVMAYIVKDTVLPFPRNLLVLGVFLSWFLTSWAGVWLGRLVRSRSYP